MITFSYGIGTTDNNFTCQAEDKLTAYAAIILQFERLAHLVILYSPDEIVDNDQWFSPDGMIEEKIDALFGGDGAFELYFKDNKEKIQQCFDTITRIK